MNIVINEYLCPKSNKFVQQECTWAGFVERFGPDQVRTASGYSLVEAMSIKQKMNPAFLKEHLDSWSRRDLLDFRDELYKYYQAINWDCYSSGSLLILEIETLLGFEQFQKKMKRFGYNYLFHTDFAYSPLIGPRRYKVIIPFEGRLDPARNESISMYAHMVQRLADTLFSDSKITRNSFKVGNRFNFPIVPDQAKRFYQYGFDTEKDFLKLPDRIEKPKNLVKVLFFDEDFVTHYLRAIFYKYREDVLLFNSDENFIKHKIFLQNRAEQTNYIMWHKLLKSEDLLGKSCLMGFIEEVGRLLPGPEFIKITKRIFSFTEERGQ